MQLRELLQQELGTAYALERELEGGGMSRVFVTEERRLGRKVVVKVLARWRHSRGALPRGRLTAPACVTVLRKSRGFSRAGRRAYRDFTGPR